MFVRDIVERPTTKPSEPSAPIPPTQRPGGFPLATHRSKGSAFARARQDSARRSEGGLAVGEGRIVDSVPSVQPVGEAGEAETVRRQIDAENAARVAGMSDAEREMEAEELMERFGSGVVDLMRKRKEARERTSADMGSSTAEATKQMQYPSTMDLSDARRILETVDAENNAKVASMSASDVGAEVRDLEERFGAGLMAKLRTRAAEKHAGSSSQHPLSRTKAEPSSSQSASQPQHAEKKAVRFDVEDSTPAGLKKYFPSVPTEDAKLQWMQGGVAPPSAAASAISSDPNAPRFDLSGAPLTPEAAAALPTHLGLHHHGDQPDLAGYTLSEIIHLCYSTVASQRITMMGVLGRIVSRFTAAGDSNEDWAKACREANVIGKGVDVACGVLSGHFRSIGVLVAAVDLLFNSLGGLDWQWMDVDTDTEARAIPFRPEPTLEGEPTGIASVPFEDLIPRLSEVLALDPGALPPTTLAQLFRILQRAALAQPAGAEAIAPLIPPMLKTHVLRAPWPLDINRPPSRVALRILRETVVSSRAAAEALIAQNVFAPLLKFAASDIASDPLSLALLAEILGIFYALGRYGLQASVATSARDIWQSLGTWVSRQLSAPDPAATEAVCAYFDLLRIWTVCAVDPHRTTPEHDLTWAQVTALGWVDELLASAKAVVGTTRWRELASILSALAEYVAGAAINGARKGEAEKAHVLQALQEMNLINALPQGADAMPEPGAREAFNSALAQVFRLHNLLRPLSLLNSPERERLIWWLMSTTQSSPGDVYLRHAALEAARTDGVLDTAKRATSAFDLVLSCVPGDEPLALSLVDDLLRTDWSKVATEDEHDHGHGPHGAATTDLTSAVAAIGHKDGLQILRPLLHHAVLPDIEGVLGPYRPSYLYLKASGTLRPPPSVVRRGPGLPLASDWAFCSLDELLASGTSSAFALAPSDWDASESQLTRATLAFARIQAATARGPSASLVILNAMKVFMLEHGQQEAPNTDQDVFRDAGVQASLKELLDSTTATGDEMDIEMDPAAIPLAPLESASSRFLTPGVPFFQFYTDLVALYESVSFGDAQFARVLLPPLAMNYSVDYRKLLWADQPGSLRSVRTPPADVPLELNRGLEVFYTPIESNKDVLLGQARALGSVLRDPATFLFDLAVHHLAGLFWSTGDTERTSIRVQIMVVVLSSAPDPVLRAILQRDVPSRRTVSSEEVARRAQTVGELTGPRGVQRLKTLGL